MIATLLVSATYLQSDTVELQVTYSPWVQATYSLLVQVTYSPNGMVGIEVTYSPLVQLTYSPNGMVGIEVTYSPNGMAAHQGTCSRATDQCSGTCVF